MPATGPNLPIVLQQSGDVTRVQELAQREGSQQQVAAQAEGAEETKRQQSQVQQSAESDGQNRIMGQQGRRRERPKKAKGGKGKPKGSKPRHQDSSGLVDVVV